MFSGGSLGIFGKIIGGGRGWNSLEREDRNDASKSDANESIRTSLTISDSDFAGSRPVRDPVLWAYPPIVSKKIVLSKSVEKSQTGLNGDDWTLCTGVGFGHGGSALSIFLRSRLDACRRTSLSPRGVWRD